MKKLRLIIILLVILFLFPLSSKLFSQEISVIEYFEKDANYDIYYDVNDLRVNVIKKARIIRLIEIKGNKFLEITNSTVFSGKEKRGYVRFSCIKAILPSEILAPEL